MKAKISAVALLLFFLVSCNKSTSSLVGSSSFDVPGGSSVSDNKPLIEDNYISESLVYKDTNFLYDDYKTVFDYDEKKEFVLDAYKRMYIEDEFLYYVTRDENGTQTINKKNLETGNSQVLYQTSGDEILSFYVLNSTEIHLRITQDSSQMDGHPKAAIYSYNLESKEYIPVSIKYNLGTIPVVSAYYSDEQIYLVQMDEDEWFKNGPPFEVFLSSFSGNIVANRIELKYDLGNAGLIPFQGTTMGSFSISKGNFLYEHESSVYVLNSKNKEPLRIMSDPSIRFSFFEANFHKENILIWSGVNTIFKMNLESKVTYAYTIQNPSYRMSSWRVVEEYAVLNAKYDSSNGYKQVIILYRYDDLEEIMRFDNIEENTEMDSPSPIYEYAFYKEKMYYLQFIWHSETSYTSQLLEV